MIKRFSSKRGVYVLTPRIAHLLQHYNVKLQCIICDQDIPPFTTVVRRGRKARLIHLSCAKRIGIVR